MEKLLVLFDLDGTLLDTIEDLGTAVNHALSLRGLPLHGVDEYRRMVGHGIRNLVQQALEASRMKAHAAEENYFSEGFPKNQFPSASTKPTLTDDCIDATLSDFRAYYQAHIDVHTRPYPGIPELLSELHARGVRLAVASNKFQEGTEYLIRRFFPGIPFVAILGNRPGWPLKPSPEIVQEVLRRAGVAPSDALLVGDSPTDMRTAFNGGIDALAVTWGYRSAGELAAAFEQNCAASEPAASQGQKPAAGRLVHSISALRNELLGNTLLAAMLAHADPSQVEGLARFFKTGPGQYGFGDKFLGIKVPVTRAVVKDCWRNVGFPELEECIASPYHEVRLAALLTLVEIFRHARRGGEVCRTACVDFYLSHTQYINNWDLVDLSCYPLLGEWLLDSPDRSLLYELARNGRTIWEQRIGIVSTMTFIRHGQLSDTFAIADILLHHPHDLIHKAVGWLLREAGKRDKSALVAYLNAAETTDQVGGDGMPGSALAVMPGPDLHAGPEPASPRYRTMPRTMLRYAIEKFPEPERQQYLAR